MADKKLRVILSWPTLFNCSFHPLNILPWNNNVQLKKNSSVFHFFFTLLSFWRLCINPNLISIGFWINFTSNYITLQAEPLFRKLFYLLHKIQLSTALNDIIDQLIHYEVRYILWRIVECQCTEIMSSIM